MAKQYYKIGDVVRLKSGGPAMTVVALSPKEDKSRVCCGWIGDDGAFHDNWFHVDCLTR